MGFTLHGALELETAFGKEARERHDLGEAGRKNRLYRQMHQVPIAPPLIVPTPTAGFLQGFDTTGPQTGFNWSVRRLVASNFTAGTVTIYRNAVQTTFGAAPAATGEILFQFPQAGTYTFGRGEMLLEPDDFMLFTCAGITLTAGQSGVLVYGSADQFESVLLPEYLM